MSLKWCDDCNQSSSGSLAENAHQDELQSKSEVKARSNKSSEKSQRRTIRVGGQHTRKSFSMCVFSMAISIWTSMERGREDHDYYGLGGISAYSKDSFNEQGRTSNRDIFLYPFLLTLSSLTSATSTSKKRSKSTSVCKLERRRTTCPKHRGKWKTQKKSE